MTTCNPMSEDCPANPALGTTAFFNFNQTPVAGTWQERVGVGRVYYDDNGARFTIENTGHAPTLDSKFYIFWGRTEIWMKTAKGRGIISSVMLLSDDLDEIDLEFRGTNDTEVLTNYYGKGDEKSAVGGEYVLPGNTQEDYHNYTIVWTSEFLEWYVDGAKIRRLEPKDAKNGEWYPQTPMRLSLGIWAGGHPNNLPGVREWAGGDTDYSQGPFNMYVKSVHVEDYSKGKEYVYGDRTGSMNSIKIVA